MFKIPNPIKTIKDKQFELGLEQGFKRGYESGKLDGYSIGYIRAINELNTSQFKEKTQDAGIFDTLDGIMLWLRGVTEILNTNFFKNLYFASSNSETIKSYLDFIDDIEKNLYDAKTLYKDVEANLLYPDVIYYLPELKIAFEKIYDNKLVVEATERMFIERSK